MHPQKFSLFEEGTHTANSILGCGHTSSKHYHARLKGPKRSSCVYREAPIFTSLYIHICTCVYICLCESVYVYMHVYIHMCVHVFTMYNMCIPVDIRVYIDCPSQARTSPMFLRRQEAGDSGAAGGLSRVEPAFRDDIGGCVFSRAKGMPQSVQELLSMSVSAGSSGCLKTDQKSGLFKAVLTRQVPMAIGPVL